MPLTPPETYTTVQVAGSSMSVLETGEGEPLLLAHSYLWDAEMWRPQIDALSDRFAILAPDLWGHGRSGALPQGTTSLRDIAIQHLALLDTLEIETVSLVGLSVGGMWGAELALIAPHRVSRLILMNTFLGRESPGPRHLYAGLLDQVAAAGAVPSHLVDVVVPMFFSQSVETTTPSLPIRFRDDLARFTSERLLDSIVPLGRMIFERRDALEELTDLTMPTLVVSGAQDVSRPPFEGLLMSEIIDCPYVELAGAGHISSLEMPDLVTSTLIEFLNATPAIA